MRIRYLCFIAFIFGLLSALVVNNHSVMAVTSTAELVAKGNVSVDGFRAMGHDTLVSGNRVITGQDSTAVINCGSLGQVFVAENSELQLVFGDASLKVNVVSGAARIKKNDNVSTSIVTPPNGKLDVLTGSIPTSDIEKGQAKIWTSNLSGDYGVRLGEYGSIIIPNIGPPDPPISPYWP